MSELSVAEVITLIGMLITGGSLLVIVTVYLLNRMNRDKEECMARDAANVAMLHKDFQTKLDARDQTTALHARIKDIGLKVDARFDRFDDKLDKLIEHR